MLQSSCDNSIFDMMTMFFCIQLLAPIIFSLTVSLSFLFCFGLFCLSHHPLHADIDEKMREKGKNLENESLCNSRCVVSCCSAPFTAGFVLLTRTCN